MYRQVPSFSVRFGAFFGGAAVLGEGVKFLPWDRLLTGYVYERWPPFPEEDRKVGRVFRLSSVACEILASCGNIAAAGTAGYLATRTIFVSKSNTVDALMARPFDTRSIIAQAGGRVGLRSAAYYGALNVAAYAAAESVVSHDPLQFLFLAPAGIFALVFGFPMFLPFLGVAWAGGRLVGFSLGNRAVAYLNAGGTTTSSLVHSALFAHPIDRFFTSQPFLATSGAVLASIVAMLPEREDFSASSGGDDGNGGFLWRYEKRWSTSLPPNRDYGTIQPPEVDEESQEETRQEGTWGRADEKRSPKKENGDKDRGGGEWV